ncbi:hypothetical protein M8C13_07295 [Crossiella sp. SN42]|uniref:hypothetical protein n=1 Tax=Crossiella sp. SN42 TaxID=2944808 RepID=UPI00207C1A65|nr:hypothetical protein [Crossiella sp. SN42]MCO1575562.1 hypothetical protein [Crossiella sp. SN42]
MTGEGAAMLARVEITDPGDALAWTPSGDAMRATADVECRLDQLNRVLTEQRLYPYHRNTFTPSARRK